MASRGRARSGVERDGVHVALLRGINVGGKNKLPMKALATIFEEAGCGDVSTWIQSGNVIFTAGPVLAERVPDRVNALIRERFGYEVPVVVRSADALERVASVNPFLVPGVDPARLHVAFLADAPSAEAVADLDPDRSPPDTFEVRGREIYLHFPNGLARTRLTNAWFDAKLGTTSTVRGWATVQKLAELAAREA